MSDFTPEIPKAELFDYTRRDFDSLREDLIRRMKKAIPEWTAYDSGFETVLIELFAYVGDILNFYIDRMGSEAYIQTATTRESILNLAAMFGYVPSPVMAAAVDVTFVKNEDDVEEAVTIPKGTLLYAEVDTSDEPIFFETTESLTIPANSASGTVRCVEGRTTRVEDGLLGASTGEELMAFQIFHPNVIGGSIRVFTDDGPVNPVTQEPTLVEWKYFTSLLHASFFDLAFTTYIDSDGYTSIWFGNGTSGRIPATHSRIYASYRYGAGAKGNVPPGAIRDFVESADFTAKIQSIYNEYEAQGGADAETIESMRGSIPRSLMTINRAVTVDDYASLSLNVAGVSKASSRATISTNVIVFVAPQGGGMPTSVLMDSVEQYLEDKKMIGTTVTVSPPTYVPIDIVLDIEVNKRYRRDQVVSDLNLLLKNYFAFDNQGFGVRLSKAEVFQEMIDLPGLDFVDIITFDKGGGSSNNSSIQLEVNEIPVLGVVTINATGGVVI